MLLSWLRRKKQPLVFTGALLDLLKEAFEDASNMGGHKAQMRAVKKAIKEAGVVRFPRMSHCVYVLARMQELVQAVSEKSEPEEEETPGFGTGFMKWVRGLSYQDMCLYLARYDAETAFRLYTRVDMQDVARLFSSRVTSDMEGFKVRFEAVMFGFGGSYGEGKDKSSEDSNTIDLRNASDDEIERIFKTMF